MKPRLDHAFIFQPFEYLEEPERTALRLQFEACESLTYFQLKALSRKHRWALSAPHGCFSNDYNASPDDEARALERLHASMKPKRFRERDITTFDGVTYYRERVLARYRDAVPEGAHRAIFMALIECIHAAEEDRTIIKGKPYKQPSLSPDQRRELFGLNRVRGVAWTPEEDAILRRWFGVRTVGEYAGNHAPLTPALWATVLAELKDLRTQHSVRQRINALNKKLLTELIQRQQVFYGTKRSEGLRRPFVPEYMQRVLGEKPRLPPMRTSQ